MGLFSDPTCPNCKGKKKVTERTRPGGCNTDWEDNVVWCSACRGTGKVRKVWTETITEQFNCPKCYGSGKLIQYQTFPDGTRKKGTEREVKCLECKGKGTWTRTRTVTKYLSPE